jgi:phosphoglycerol transferase MdoB-like AlkP superfamily enzyme
MVPLAIDKLYLLILKKNNSMIIITKHKQVYYKMTLSKWSKYFWNFTTYKETTGRRR